MKTRVCLIYFVHDCGIKPLDLNDKFKVAFRNSLSEVKFSVTDKLSMVSNDSWANSD